MIFSTFLSVVIVIAAIFGDPLKYLSVPVNLYNVQKYAPSEIFEYYTEFPLSDLRFNIPILYDSEFKLVDINEVMEIQIQAKLLDDFRSLVDISMPLVPATQQQFSEGALDKDKLFIQFLVNENNGFGVDPVTGYGQLIHTLKSLDENDVPFFFTQFLTDYCFNTELGKYTPSSFYKFTDAVDSKIRPVDSMDNAIFSRLMNSSDKIDINIKFHVINTEDNGMKLNFFRVYDQLMKPFIEEKLSDFFTFHVSLMNYDIKDSKAELGVLDSVDESFPGELLGIPLISKIYQSKFDNNPFDINLVYYPYEFGGEFVKNMTFYHEHLNNPIEIPNWGVVYFSHDRLEFHEESRTFSLSSDETNHMEWVFNKQVLDLINAPNPNLSIHLRERAFKRYLIVAYLSEFGSLMNSIKSKLNHDKYSSYFWEVNGLLASLTDLFQKRAEILDLVRLNELDEALLSTQAIFFQLKDLL